MQPSADTAAVLAPDRARRFLIQAALWNVTLFALLRLPWIEQHLIGALVEFQRVLVAWYRPAPAGVVVNASCSGADVMALCAGIAIAYPTTWRKRVWGATCGVLLILALNCVRIAWLFALAPDAARLQLWHVYLWPVLLSAAVLLYVLAWIRWAEGTRRLDGWGRFAATAGVGLAVYAAIVPWAFTSPALHDAAKWTAAIAAALLAPFAATAHASGAMLVTDRGLFLVTQECLFTPMLPLYAALVLSVPMPWRRRALALLAAVPIFLLLGVARVLVLALPPYIVSSPLVLAHGFYQLVAGGAILIGAAHLRLGRDAGTRATQATIGALAIAMGTGVALGGGWTWLVRHVAEGARWLLPATFASFSHPADAQGALALLPAFQFSLLVGLWFAITGGARRGTLAGALAVLAASQVALLAALGIASSDGSLPHALAIRAWAIAVPVGLAIVFRRPAATTVGDPAYQDFWHGVGAEFPVLTGAASTDFYFENEQRLLRESLPPLAGLKLLKTDLWDEAKNTRILQWAADQGAAVYGLDLSEPIIRQAQSAFGPARRLRPVMSDVRRLPFADESFDAVYSMGTVEHFAETGPSVTELARVLRPGGRLVLGVPNRHDPFLRPLMVAALNAVGLYGYGYERSFSRQALRRMLEEAGLRVRMESGILFIPGWLRMLDLWCFTRARPLARVTAQLVRPFAWLERHAPALRRHGYLIASVGEKPVREGPGVHYLIDARGCDAAALCSLPRLQALFARIIDELSLTVVAPPVWHVFPGTGGITGMVLLGESHLTIHTFPESDRAAIDLYCCRRSADWEWAENLRQALGAGDVTVRVIRRCDIPFSSSTLREE